MFRTALVFCLVVVFFGIADATTIYVNETGWWFEGGSFNSSNTPIQSAVNAASDGDLILLKDGSYEENVFVRKSVEVRSENGSEKCIVSAAKSDEDVFNVEDTENVTISGLTIRKAKYKSGVRLFNSSNCTISNCYIAENGNGVYVRGTKDEPSKFNRIIACEITNNGNGVKLSGAGCTENVLEFNTISRNDYGLYLIYADFNEITSNEIGYNGIGIYLKGGSEDNVIRYNYIANNEWNVYNDQLKDVDARYNHWNLHTNESIDDTIYDDEEGKGVVHFYPFLENPAPIFEISAILLSLLGVAIVRKSF